MLNARVSTILKKKKQNKKKKKSNTDLKLLKETFCVFEKIKFAYYKSCGSFGPGKGRKKLPPWNVQERAQDRNS